MSNQVIPLTDIEVELRELSVRQKKHWQRIVYLLLTVQKGELFRPAHGSFSDWLRHFAAAVGLHEATFWRYYAAGAYYLEKTGEPVEAIERATVSPHKLELVRRIEEHDEDTGKALFEAVVADDPQATMRFLNQTWEKTRDGRTHEETKTHELQPVAQHLSDEFQALTDNNKLLFVNALLDAISARGARDILDRALVLFNESKTV